MVATSTKMKKKIIFVEVATMFTATEGALSGVNFWLTVYKQCQHQTA